MPDRPTTIAVLDDHAFMLQSLANLPAVQAGTLDIVVAETDPEAFLRAVEVRRPDVAVVDLMLDGQVSGHLTIRALQDRRIPSIAFTAEQRRVPVKLAIQAGARGLVLKSDPVSQLVSAIEEVAATGWAESSLMAQALVEESQSIPTLTQKELRCLRLAGQGVPIKAIGRQFDPPISLGTVKTYLARAFEKYAAVGRSVANTTQAAMETAADGWFDVGPEAD